MIDWSIDWMIDRLNDWTNDWLIDWMNDWSIDWSIDCLGCKFKVLFFIFFSIGLWYYATYDLSGYFSWQKSRKSSRWTNYISFLLEVLLSGGAVMDMPIKYYYNRACEWNNARRLILTRPCLIFVVECDELRIGQRQSRHRHRHWQQPQPWHALGSVFPALLPRCRSAHWRRTRVATIIRITEGTTWNRHLVKGDYNKWTMLTFLLWISLFFSLDWSFFTDCRRG